MFSEPFFSLCTSLYLRFSPFLSLSFVSVLVLASLWSGIARASKRSRISVSSSTSLSGGRVRHSLICSFFSVCI